MPTIKDTDLLLVHRDGVDYKITVQDLKEYLEVEPMPWDTHNGGIWHVVIPDGYTSSYPNLSSLYLTDERMFNLDGTQHVRSDSDQLVGPIEIMILTDPVSDGLFVGMADYELGELTDTKHVTSMRGLFTYSRLLGVTTDFTTWDVSKVQDMYYMFNMVPALPKFVCPDWDLSSCTNFNECMPDVKGTGNVDISNWKLNTSEDVEMRYTFSWKDGYEGADLSKWDVRGVVDFDSTFAGCDFDGDISSWCVAHIPSEPDNFAGKNSPILPEFMPKWGQPC